MSWTFSSQADSRLSPSAGYSAFITYTQELLKQPHVTQQYNITMEWSNLALCGLAAVLGVVAMRFRTRIPPFRLARRHVVLYGHDLPLLERLTRECYFAGAKVTLLYSCAASKAAVSNLIASLERHCGRSARIKCLEYNPAKANSSLTEAERNSHGAFEVLIICSGQAPVGDFLDLSIASVAETMQKNYLQAAELIKLVGGKMQARGGGRICVVETAAACLNLPGACSPAAEALKVFADAMRCELPAVPVLFMGLSLLESNKESGSNSLEAPISLEEASHKVLLAIQAGKSVSFSRPWQSLLSIATEGPTERFAPVTDTLLAGTSVLFGFTYWRLYLPWALPK